MFSPVSIRPFPKAGARKETKKGRKKRSTAILTDTPVKQALEEERDRRRPAPRRLNMTKVSVGLSDIFLFGL